MPKLPRLTTPLVRRDGRLREASWEEALNTAAEGLRRVKDSTPEGAPSPVGFFSCSKATNEVNYVAQKFMRLALGSNNIDSCNRT